MHSPEPPNTANKDSINILDYLEILAQNLPMIVKFTCAACTISIIYSLYLPNIYSTKALILPPQQDSSGLMGMLIGSTSGIGGVTADLLGKGTTADMYVSILKSEAISDIIIDRFKLMEVYEKKYRVETYKTLDNVVNIAAGKKDGIIVITVEDKNPKLATDIANAYVEELDKFATKLNITGAGQNRLFYEKRLTKARVDLANAEDNLKVFQSQNKALDITEQAKGTIKGVADLEGQLAVEEVKLAGIRRILTDFSQEVKNQRAVIINIKSQIAKFEGNRSGAAVPGISSVPELGQQYMRLMRNFKTQETIVELLTKQYEMSKLSESRNSASIQTIQTARIPDKKSKPKRSLIVLATTFASNIGAILYAFIREANKRMPENDREQWLRIIGKLPSLRTLRKKKS